MRILVTGGAGFIGSWVIRHLLRANAIVCNVDALTYAGSLATVSDVVDNPSYSFEQVDICDRDTLELVIYNFHPTAIMHLAAESHVDRSITGSWPTINTNIVGTYTLLEAARQYWVDLPAIERDTFRFLHVSTDEVFGALGATGAFTEESQYRPSSPYSASKAASDHLVRAWHHTFGLPTLTTNCSNNYGPYQYPEKLIPLMIRNALLGKQLPVYGRGENIRDWLHVEDHVRALLRVLAHGRPGESYAIGGNCEWRNIDIVTAICTALDEIVPDSPHVPHESLIAFVEDRPGHDLRYAIDATKLRGELGWEVETDLDSALRDTVRWYIDHAEWCDTVLAGAYGGERLGLPA